MALYRVVTISTDEEVERFDAETDLHARLSARQNHADYGFVLQRSHGRGHKQYWGEVLFQATAARDEMRDPFARIA